MKRIALENLPKLYAAIGEKQSLFLPVKVAGQTNFGIWTEETEVDLGTLKTVKSAKDVFFPQSENLYTCYRDGKKISIVPEKLEEKDKYSVFFGNQYGYMEIRGQEEGRGKLLVIKDSFAHAVLPMLAADYDLDVLDLRYNNNKGTPAQILERGGYDAVIVLCSTPLLTDPVIGRLPMEQLLIGMPE